LTARSASLPNGNPQAQNLFAVLNHLQKQANLQVEVKPVRRRRAGGGTSRAGSRA